MGFFGRKSGLMEDEYSPTWAMHSQSDPRWNASGTAFGMWDAIARHKQAVEERTKLYGDPPADLEVSYNKP